MKSACVSRDLQKFSITFNSWLSGSPHEESNICDLDSVMLEALQLDHPEFVSELLRLGHPMHKDYALEAIKHKSRDILNIFLENGWNVNEPMSELKPPVLG